MLLSPLLIPPSDAFWQKAARALLDHEQFGKGRGRDLSSLLVVVSSFAHAPLLRNAIAELVPQAFIPPRITTLPSWLSMLPPEPEDIAVPESERLMSLYAELRQHGWLKKLFGARRNTDLLPLAQTLLNLFDQLSAALLPVTGGASEFADERWRAALEHISPAARDMLSNEAELVWSLWKSQIDKSDPIARRYAQMMRLAAQADSPLVWINVAAPDAMESAFLAAYGTRQTVLPIHFDWCDGAVLPAYVQAWREIAEGESVSDSSVTLPSGLSLCEAKSLEDEATQGAQIVTDWLRENKRVAIIAQDRVVARRMRALLERAQVVVADETGWKLSTTRAASAIAAWLTVVATRAETTALLDLLKSPYLFADVGEKPDIVMSIESALLRGNVPGGWDAVCAAVEDNRPAQDLLQRLVDQSRYFAGRKTLSEWLESTVMAVNALGMQAALASDGAGTQVLALLANLMRDCDRTAHVFSFAEWRAFINLQLESAPFIPEDVDKRVVMMQLAGARLRRFDAVLMVGADADHLPSKLQETLFFANAVRRELGLATREMQHRMQLRDVVELLSVNPEVVLSWQSFKSGEPNAISPWIERLRLTLERAGAGTLPMRTVIIPERSLARILTPMPAPAAPRLTPEKLSASGYNSLVACPYQFFATRMLHLSGMDELSELPEKRDYGDWLHRILTTYHEAVRDRKIPLAEREALLQAISQKVFDAELVRSGAALGFYTRWQKAMPAYLEWANERESKGWLFVMGEGWFDKTLHWEGGKITLHGRIDRIDENGEGERAVLDYKTRNVGSLRKKLNEGEDHQLAFYGLLSDRPVDHATYVALEPTKEKIESVDAPGYEEWKTQLETRIVDIVQAIANNATLPASGINDVCRYCDVRGLCRKGAWE